MKQTLAVFILSLVVLPAMAQDHAKILMGPNLRVSRDGDVPHVEPHIAVNPRNRKNMVGAAITATRPEGGLACRTYSTHDGGATWRAAEFPEQVAFGGGDPQVIFTPRGTAIFVSIAMGSLTDDNGRERGGTHVYRSEDGGRRWTKTVDICCGLDHPQMAVDHTLGRFAGRIYLGALYFGGLDGPPVYTVGIFRSSDDGRSFIGPVEAANGGGEFGINVVDIQVLSDGTLVVPYIDFEFKPEKRQTKGRIRGNAWFTHSTDGGLTFSEPSRGHFKETNLDDPDHRRVGGFLAVSADSGPGKYRDRLYMAWSDMRFGKSRVLFSYSDDLGESWSEPAMIDAEVQADSLQFMPEVAVNPDGVVGIFWHDTRDNVEEKLFHGYFTASLDGGATFLPSLRVSSMPSDPYGQGNLLPSPMIFGGKDAAQLVLISAASRWPAGGDYIGLATDRTGTFWPLWPDARTGTFQLYTAELRVEDPRDPPAPHDPEPKVEISLLGKVEFLFDPIRYDGDTQTAEIPVRLKNVSGAAIYPPISIEILGFGFGTEGKKELEMYKNPVFLNAVNGKQSEGATFNFDDALGNYDSFEPDTQTGPVVLKLKLVDPLMTPSVGLAVRGYVVQK